MNDDLIAAIELADETTFRDRIAHDRSRVGPINYIWGLHKPALVSLVTSDAIDEARKIAFSSILMAEGANARRGAYVGQDAISLARQRGLERLARHLESEHLNHGPAQTREARKQDIKDLRLHYSKAGGYIYRIGDFDYPFYFGGDYDGACPCAVAALESEPTLDWLRDEVRWFQPFADRLLHGQPISLGALMKHADRFTVTRESERNNWDYGF